MAGKNVGESNLKLLRMIEDYKLSKCVHLLGHRKDIEKLMIGIDVHVSASHTEAFPNVIGEAMASGTPSVATDVGDSAWIIGETGKVVPRGNMKALAEGVTDLLMMPLENRQALGRKARARIKEEFEIGKVARLYQEYFFYLADSR
jgi:glycosyltransferase involved in cell wall biosynthesis